jgi:hypothetical protein
MSKIIQKSATAMHLENISIMQSTWQDADVEESAPSASRKSCSSMML